MSFVQTPGIREDLYDVTGTIVGTDGQKCAFTFDKMSGGDVTAKDTKHRPANGTEDEISLGGSTTVSNITVERLYDIAIDGWVHWLITQCGKGTFYVSKQPLDANGAPFGTALNYKGILLACTPPVTDASSENASMISLQQSSVTPIT
jgi:hypothetical protein